MSASIRMPRSTALTMSYTVSAAIDAAVNASISTPVRPVVRTVASISTVSAPSARRSTLIAEIGSGWHSGIRSAVRLAAMIPASRATPNTSPFLASPERISAKVAGSITTRARAVALRAVSGLAPTSTIAAAPLASKWVSRGSVIPLAARGSPIPHPAGASGFRRPGSSAPRRWRAVADRRGCAGRFHRSQNGPAAAARPVPAWC